MRGALIGIHLSRPRLSLRTLAAPETVTPVLEEVRFQCKRASTFDADPIERHGDLSLEAADRLDM